LQTFRTLIGITMLGHQHFFITEATPPWLNP
jgi:hypothetical protein